MRLKGIVFPLIIAALLGGGYIYINFFGANVSDSLQEEGYLKIPDGSTYQDLVNILNSKHFIEDQRSFDAWASYLDFKTPRPGRYKIIPGWSSYELIRHLERGEQATVKITLNNERTLPQLAAKLSRFLEADSAGFMETFKDKALLDSLGATQETLMSLFLANTYDFYWNTSPKVFVEKMHKESRKFWTEKRLQEANALHLNLTQLYTLASIVEGESSHADEQPKVAGTYLNRLNKHIKLQADPTVQFALIDAQGGTFRRLYNNDYAFSHPYNTYLNEGLPPGPVCITSAQAIDATLHAENNNYIFFVARPDNSGYHNFAENFEAHQVNVKLYHEWLALKERKSS